MFCKSGTFCFAAYTDGNNRLQKQSFLTAKLL